MAQPRVSVVVPNWNGQEFLPSLLDALAGQSFRDFELVVVDNGSEDGSREWLAARPEVRLLALARNHGFAGAMNRGVAEASADLLVFLNSDMSPEPGFLAALVAAADDFPAAASFAALVLCRARPGVIDSAGDRMSASGRSTGIARGEPLARTAVEPCWIFGATGGAALWRRPAFLAAGGFDEDFFLYVEDTDLALRAQRLGLGCRLVPGALTLHVGSGSLRGQEDRRARFCLRNHLLFLVKDYPSSLLLANAGAIGRGIVREVSFAFGATRTHEGALGAAVRVLGTLLDALRLAPRMWLKRMRLARSVVGARVEEWFR